MNREFVGVEEGSHFLVLRSGIGVLCILQVFIDVCVRCMEFEIMLDGRQSLTRKGLDLVTSFLRRIGLDLRARSGPTGSGIWGLLGLPMQVMARELGRRRLPIGILN